MRTLILILFIACSLPSPAAPATCTYTTYKWNVHLRRAVDIQFVRIPYHRLSAPEIDERTGCTVCEEDQTVVRLPGIPPFRICRHLAARITAVLEQALAAGELITEVRGYRVGKTRGEMDRDGNRTRFSNHAFGVAVDINPRVNGLYDHCIRFGPSCRLIKGGEWRPGRPGSIAPDSVLVRAMANIGMQWGGVIKGRQKDFMHFSLTGY